MGTSLVVPFKRLPSGYTFSLGAPPEKPVKPRPAATVTLLRRGPGGLEVLLLKRGATTRFLPGAFVFPGGRVEEGDGSTEVQALVDGLGPDEANRRLGFSGSDARGLAFWVAGLRETFEETGILLGSGGGEGHSVSAEGKDPDSRLRLDLHHGRKRLPEVLKALNHRFQARRLMYVAHWVTPVQEPYRYDTRFFAAEVPAHLRIFPDGIELVESHWLTPEHALERNRAGSLPMVFPTMATLEALTAFSDPGEAMKALGGREVPRLLPRVEEVEGGIRMVL
jgi:8-oxo-dGTP pyrophosphatase MutT (NUDIX family)